MERGIWQVSGGPVDRSYADIFLKFGVGLIGPGDAGLWKAERDDDEFEGGFVRRFATEVKAREFLRGRFEACYPFHHSPRLTLLLDGPGI